GVDHDHRDARVAIGLDRAGRVVIALTRFVALGEALSRLPFGLTTPEMAAVMGAVGCDRAVLLDGGASSQLMVKDGDRERTWRGIRRVPVGLVVVPRER
ncbi:MAG: phosphodiester glycosidase family protein, partial [Gemmatimonadota bacterium]|nr:phosphodiester glycosidase family protein [Gemmatimonadota bacterium]